MNLSEQLDRALEPGLARLLREAGSVAAQSHTPLYLVGGSVRDILLTRPVLDLDMVAEGDASHLAHQLAKHLSGQVVSRSQFGTAKVKVNGHTLDLATARRERYARPGALPTVAPGTIHDDLLRRDFTINSLAVQLAPDRYGEALDEAGGLADLEKGLVRVLHDASFRDDATRILRAVRYEQRLDFRLEEHTERLLRRDLSYLDTISPVRVRRELERALEEPNPARPLLRATELGVLGSIYPPLHALGRHRQAVEAINSQKGASPLLYLALMAWAMDQKESEDFIERLRLTARQARVVRDTQRVKNLAGYLASPGLRPSQVYHALCELSLEAAQTGALAVEDNVAREHLGLYVERWHGVHPSLTGHDLLRLGMPQGPPVGQMLEELRRARLDGEVASRAEEEALVERRLEDS